MRFRCATGPLCTYAGVTFLAARFFLGHQESVPPSGFVSSPAAARRYPSTRPSFGSTEHQASGFESFPHAAILALSALGAAALTVQAGRRPNVSRRAKLDDIDRIPINPNRLANKMGYGTTDLPMTTPGTVYEAGWGLYHRGTMLRLPGTDHWKRDRKQAGSPQKIPVKNLEGLQIGEETMYLRCLSKGTANYVVWKVHGVWKYWQRKFRAWLPWKEDVWKKRKPFPQKGTGRARQRSRADTLSGLAHGRNKPHGWDKAKYKKHRYVEHQRCIATVMQSKWKKIHIVDGLEEAFPQPKHYQMCKLIKDITLFEPGERPTLFIGRYADRNEAETANNLYYSTRLIRDCEVRKPEDIDANADGLHRLLWARQIIIDRAAYFDLMAKFNAKNGWAFRNEKKIQLYQLRMLAKEFPKNTQDRYRERNKLPRTKPELREWAKKKREERSMSEMMAKTGAESMPPIDEESVAVETDEE